MADSSSSSVSIDSINSMIGATNTSRVSGLASGIDVDSIVAKLMTAESQPLVQMQQNLQLTEWQRDDYRSMNTLLSNLQTTIQKMKLQGPYLAKTATSSDSSKVTATGGANSGNVAYTLSNVTMATAAHNNSEASIVKENQTFDSSKSLLSQKDALDQTFSSPITFTITTYNDGTATSRTFSYDDPSTTSLDKIMSDITSSDIGVNAFYDSATGKVSMTRTATGDNHLQEKDENELPIDGTGAEIEFSGDFLTKTLNLDSTNEQEGTDAKFTLNGLETSRHSNTFTVSGVTFNLQSSFSGSASINIGTDTDAVFKSISDFVSQYNDIIKQINDKISETRNRDYSPLTDAQKSSMSDSDVTAWTTKAQSGMLANDSILSGALSQMRMDLYSSVSGTSNTKMNQLSEMGITTSSNYLDHGKLVIDEDKLKEAISTDPQAVMEMFSNTGTTSSSQGIMQRLNTTLKNTMDQIEDKAGNTNMVYTQYSMGKSIDDMNDRIDAFKLRLQDIQTRYYTQFDAMEAAIQQSNSQATYLSQFTSS
ncbi:flagellar hook-associated protein 2 [Sporolactobacillus nakayamae]|uniref:Flagellar hook-associated protein 2 n=1 Tax=Sporolactobacillus nakayamae TaxID=269670 RepID=A0A1I2WGW9_9BACL|nr:flagellar hook-associated protein 2 [Sporolactobacillus nakayamae]SFH00575.1 flagellar hook-associated protein 2 [Sporolactobacillus nakayamae]